MAGETTDRQRNRLNPLLCPVCSHQRALHVTDTRLPGEPVLCSAGVGMGNECGCDGQGQATARLYDRAARLLSREVAADWWLGANDYLAGARPVDLMKTERLDEVGSALDAAEQQGWGS